MSAGKFEDGKYASGPGLIYSVRVQPESKGLTLNSVANAYPMGDTDPELGTLQIRKSRRGFGVVARTVTVELTADGTGATAEYEEGSLLSVPVFQASVWSGYGKGQTGTYLGIACRFSGKSPENIR